MSANEKDLRAAKKAERKAAAAAEQDKKDRSYRRTVGIVAVILIVLIAGALFINSDFLYTHTTAATIGSTKYTPAEVSFFERSTYTNIYENLYSQLGDMTSYLLDSSTPLSEQDYPYGDSEGETWADVIKESAREEMVRVTALYDAAVAAGHTLSDENRATVDSTVETMKQYAESGGYPNVDKFLSAYYGKGMNLKTFTKLQERVTLAYGYSEALQNSFSYTDEELDVYYEEHAEEFDRYAYYAYPVSNSLSAFEGLEGDALAEAVHNAAQAIVDAAVDADAFIRAVKDLAGEDVITKVTSTTVANVGDAYKDWVTDPARQPGDVTVIDMESLSYAMYFVELNRNDYNTVDFRHILVEASPNDDGVYTEEAIAFAKDRAEELLAEWRMNPTEDNFSELAAGFSTDTGSNSNGGLYSGVTKYQMVKGVNDFLFNDGNGVGDSDVVFGESDSYKGYHVVYFAGENGLYRLQLAENAKRSEDYTAAYDALASGYTAAEGFGSRFVTAL